MPSKRLYVFKKPWLTSAGFERCRLRFDDFFVKICRFPGRFLFSFPVAVTLIRDAIDLLVFLFVTRSSPAFILSSFYRLVQAQLQASDP